MMCCCAAAVGSPGGLQVQAGQIGGQFATDRQGLREGEKQGSGLSLPDKLHVLGTALVVRKGGGNEAREGVRSLIVGFERGL